MHQESRSISLQVTGTHEWQRKFITTNSYQLQTISIFKRISFFEVLFRTSGTLMKKS